MTHKYIDIENKRNKGDFYKNLETSTFSNHFIDIAGLENTFKHPGDLLKSFDVFNRVLSSLPENFDPEIAKYIIKCIKKIENNIQEIPSSDLINIPEEMCQICFILLEKLIFCGKQECIIIQVAKILEKYTEASNFKDKLVSFMSNEDSGWMLEFIVTDKIVPFFISIFLNSTNMHVLKNCSIGLLPIYDNYSNLISLEETYVLLDNENFFVRTTYLDILFRGMQIQIKAEEYQMVSDLVSVIAERARDIHYLVRSKAVSIINQILEDKLMPNAIRNNVLKLIIARIIDKTQVVRKKSLRALCTAIKSNPFFLNASSLKKIEKPEDQYSKDLNEFHEVFSHALKSVNVLIKSRIKSEINEVCELVNLCYFYDISGSIEAFNVLFYYSLNDKVVYESIILYLLALLNGLKSRKMKFFLEFEPSDFLNLIINEVSRRKIFDEESFEDMYRMVVSDVPRSFYILKCCIKYLNVDGSRILDLVNFITDQFFKSTSEKELYKNTLKYRTMLEMLINLNNKDINHSIVGVLTKNYAKMNFFDYEIAENTIKICFKSGLDYEKRIQSLLKVLCTKNPNKLKILSAIGCIALEQSNIIDLIDMKAKKFKANVKPIVPIEIKERRRSINASRMSIQPRVSDDVEAKKALDNIIDKPEDEIADILFFVKEREICFGKNSLLKPFMQMVIDSCSSDDEEVQKVAYLSLLKCMTVSSEFFEKNMHLFFEGLSHKNCNIRNNCIIAIRDYFFNYNFLLEKNMSIIFQVLHDSETIVRFNSIVIIFDLLLKNVIKPTRCGNILLSLLLDKDEVISDASYAFFQKICKNETMIASILYESLLYGDKEDSKKILLIILPLISDKVKEACFSKLLRYKENKAEILRFYLKNACFTEKFISEMSGFKDFNEINS